MSQPVQLPVKSLDLAPYMKSVSGNYPTKLDTPIDARPNTTQLLAGRVIAKVQAMSQTFKVWADASKTKAVAHERRVVFLDLTNSEFSAPNDLFDEHTCKGWFLESVTYRAWLQDPGQPADATKARSDWSIVSEGPTTQNQTGSITSSVSFTFDGSGGMFGKEGVGNAGAAISVSNSVSYTLTAFTFKQHSDSRVLSHAVQMTMTGDGNAYASADDLVDYSLVNVGVQLFANPTNPILLRPLPNLATSNVPLVGQAVWMNDADSGLVNSLELHLSAKARYILVKAWSDPPVQKKYSIADVNFEDKILIDFTLL